jgi:hypothetical protein
MRTILFYFLSLQGIQGVNSVRCVQAENLGNETLSAQNQESEPLCNQRLRGGNSEEKENQVSTPLRSQRTGGVTTNIPLK